MRCAEFRGIPAGFHFSGATVSVGHMLLRVLALTVAVQLLGCGSSSSPGDAGLDAAVPDAAVSDAGAPDAGGGDAGLPDAGELDAGSADAGPRVDCTGACAVLVIAGDPPAALPDGGASPARGYADPTMREDPNTGRLWMAYSWPWWDEAGRVVRVDNHLAHSDDRGATWQFDRVLWRSQPELDPSGSGLAGFSNHETVSMTPRRVGATTVWYYARMRYFTRPVDGHRFVTFHTRVGRVASPLVLSDAPESEEAVLGGALTPAGWDVTVRLSDFPGLDGCTFFDAGVLWAQDRLRLGVQCLRFTPTGEEDVARELVALFSTDAAGAPRSWQWRFDGVLTTAADAAFFGHSTLLQTELAFSRDGAVLALLSPSEPGATLATHDGCRAVEVAALDQAALRRDAAGNPLVRGTVVDDLGTGACTYEPAATTGVVMMRRYQAPGVLRGGLLATGLHP
ncbi:MAG: sialidase family protein [Myxococcota bacterium]